MSIYRALFAAMLLCVSCSSTAEYRPEQRQLIEQEVPQPPEIPKKAAVEPSTQPKSQPAHLQARQLVEVNGNPFSGRHYDLVYPETWTRQDNFMRTDTMAVSPAENGNDPFLENVNVALENLASPMTLQDYVDANVRGMQQALNGFRVISERDRFAGAVAAKELVYEHSHANGTFRVKAIFYTEGSAGYVISCTALASTFAQWEPVFDTTISTFRLLP